jgi:hypothetical protein
MRETNARFEMKNPIGVQSSKPDRIDIAMTDGRWRCRHPSLRVISSLPRRPK